jgi:hypothetical protein
MDYFLSFADRDNVRNVISTAMENESVQGVVLEIDPVWLNMWRLRESFGQDRANRLIERYFESRIFGPLFPFSEFNQLNRYWIPNRPLREYDFNWTPSIWDVYQREFWNLRSAEESSKIIIKICLYPSNSFQERAIPTFQETNLKIIYETRPPAIFYNTNPRKSFRPILGGVSIGAGQKALGTLGGILRSSSGNFYGLTCTHVINKNDSAQQPAWSDDSQTTDIGNCTHSNVLISCNSKDPCSIWAEEVAVNEVDSALIRLNENTSSKLEILQIGKLTGITPRANLTQGQAIELVGRTSGHKRLEIGGISVAYRITDSDKKHYCFHNLIELKDPSHWSNVISSPVQPGDSGAWICTPSSQGFEWCGMVIGGDRYVGFAVSSEAIEDWWKNEEQLDLSVV